MLRAAVWTICVFGAGELLVKLFPQPVAQPLVLMSLGITLVWASARTSHGQARKLWAGLTRVASSAPDEAAASERLAR
jgi:hypothetical protein